jgi:hypothetical protein
MSTSPQQLRTKDGDGRPTRENGRFANTKTETDVSLTPTAPDLAGVPTPLCSPQGLTHVGTLDASDKSRNLLSYEGQGLSVSQHPHAWAKIARLGGPVWSVERRGAKFLSYHELTVEQRDAIDDWGVERGYVERRPAFKISEWNDEADDYQWHMTLSANEAEAERIEARDYKTGALVEECVAVVSTDAFPDSTVRPGQTNVEQVLSTLWVAECAPDIDGVWWQDTYDPDGLTAPRGVLVMSRIADWVGSALPFDGDDQDDDDWPVSDDDGPDEYDD